MRRLSTGIPQLDIILGGGLPVGSLIVVAGAPGTGKTILAQQIRFSNASSEHRAVYYSTISEPPDKFISHLEVFDFFDRSALDYSWETFWWVRALKGATNICVHKRLKNPNYWQTRPDTNCQLGTRSLCAAVTSISHASQCFVMTFQVLSYI